jgi:hypothetical protein
MSLSNKSLKMTKKNQKINIEYLELESVPIQINLDDESGQEKKLPTFSMVAYTGAAFSLGYGWSGIVDLQGLQIPLQKISARFQHDENKGVGHTTNIKIENGKVLAEGVISRETKYAEDVKSSFRNGFPWQVSMGLSPIMYQFLREGESSQVNGRTIKGPAYIFRKMALREVSFVDSGADKNTSAKIRLSSDSQNIFNFNNNEEFSMAKTNLIPENENSGEQTQMMGNVQLSTDNTQTSPHQHPQQVQLQQPVQLQPQQLSQQSPSSQTSLQPQPQMVTLSLPANFSFPMQAQPTQTSNQSQTSPDLQLAENRRIAAIEHLGGGRFLELESQAISDGWTIEKFKGELNAKLIPNANQIQMSSGENTNGLNTNVLEAIALRNNGISMSFLEKEYEPKTLELSDNYYGYGLQEFCQLAVPNLPNYKRNASGWLQMAFSSATLPGIFSNVANKSLLEGFFSVDTEWKKIVKLGSVTNFHRYTRYRMNAAFEFDKVGADGELKHGQLGEEHYTQQIDTYGKMFALTRQMIINDDLGALSDIPRYIGVASADKINDLVWQTFLESKTSDGKELFHANHKNLIMANLDVEGLTAAELAFALQERKKGRPMGVQPKYILVPISLKVKAEILMKSLTLDGATVLSGTVNPHAGKFEIVASSYLQASGFSGSSDKNWYLLADPNRLPVLELAFLSGKQNPTIERADADFNTLGVQFRGFHDFGVSPQDYRGVLKVTPTT